MEELRLSVGDKQDARVALLSYYSSECIAHGAYLVALAVGFLGLVEVAPYVLGFAAGVFSPVLSEGFVGRVVLGLVVSGFVVLVVYVFCRVVVWGYLRLAVVNVRPKGGGEVEVEAGQTVTFMWQLHEGCLDYVGGRHGWWVRVYGLGVWYLVRVWVGLFVVFLVVSVLL